VTRAAPPADLDETVDLARERAKGASGTADEAVAARLAAAVVYLADACPVGAPCDRHYGAVHGGEAEELRAGVEQIVNAAVAADADAALDALRETRLALIALLDRVDARDSLAFREATDGDGDDAADDRDVTAVETPSRRRAQAAEVDEAEAYRARCAARRAFFAARTVGDKISWGDRRSGVIQEIGDEYVTVLDDGWPADPPLCVYTPPFVARLKIDYMLHLVLVEKAPS
jgi:uncharacterized MAPEG superfamily protein